MLSALISETHASTPVLRVHLGVFAWFVAALLCSAPAGAQDDRIVVSTASGTSFTAAQIDSMLAEYPPSIRKAYKREGLVWHGMSRYITFEELAAYCGPILWFSPDEPLLHGLSGREIDQPRAFPFETPATRPVCYYRVRTVLRDPERQEPTPVLSAEDPQRRTTRIDLRQVVGIDLDYFFFYPSEEGLGAHKYDVESVEFTLIVAHTRRYPELGYWIVAEKVVAKAHGILWYDNTLEIDRFANLPLHILVEEGKHASCTDKNGDGFYSPGYDVNKRVNDAWGVRDVMATGSLYTGSFESWMAKPRPPEYRVFPPLPADSPVRDKHVRDGIYAPDNAVYELRPFPRAALAEVYDPELTHFIADKGSEQWPTVELLDELKQFKRWTEGDAFVKSVSLSYRYDGDHGLSVVFPLLIVKNVEVPVGGGWLVNRVFFTGKKLDNFAWNVMYTTSASRWLDGYFAVGWKWDHGPENSNHLLTETGIKFRFNMGAIPLRFLTKLTDFWGIRIGLWTYDFAPISELGYAIEIGAGTF